MITVRTRRLPVFMITPADCPCGCGPVCQCVTDTASQTICHNLFVVWSQRFFFSYSKYGNTIFDAINIGLLFLLFFYVVCFTCKNLRSLCNHRHCSGCFLRPKTHSDFKNAAEVESGGKHLHIYVSKLFLLPTHTCSSTPTHRVIDSLLCLHSFKTNTTLPNAWNYQVVCPMCDM